MIRSSHRSHRQPSALGPVLPLEDRLVPATAFALSNNALIPFDTTTPAAVGAPVAVTGLGTGENLVGIDFRPQNGLLYGLTSNGAGAVRLYQISTRTGFATPLTAAPVQFDDGTNPVPITGTNFGLDFNPTVDRIRVVTDTGFNFRMDPNTGALVDSDMNAANGVTPDGMINGPVTGVDAAAYTNNSQNATATTLYTLNSAANALYIQNPPNDGTQINTLFITLNGSPLDFTTANGFDIPAAIDVSMSNAPATGKALAAFTVGGSTGLYQVELSTGAATLVGQLGDGTAAVQGFAVADDPGSLPAVGLDATGMNLVRFSTDTPGTGVMVAVAGLTMGETLVGIDYRPQTGQLFGLGVDAAADTGTVYRIDPQMGTATPIGTPSQVMFVDGTGAKVDLPPALAGYGFDFNPTVDRIRVTTGTGLNARLNPDTGAPIDGDLGGAPMSVMGINPDGPINTFVTGIDGAGYTNSFAQNLTGGVTTLYTLSATANALYIQNPPNDGTQTNPIPITLDGASLDFTEVNGFDIPASVQVGTSNAPATGRAVALLTVGGTTSLYSIDLATGAATNLGAATALAGGSGVAVGDGQLTPVTLDRNVGVGGSPNGQVSVFAPAPSGQYSTTPISSLTPFPGFTGTIRSATGDVDGDGTPDTIVVTGPGAPIQFAVISGADNTTMLVSPTSPFSGSEDFTGGGFVASADIDGDGLAEIVVTPDQGGGPRVTIFSLLPSGLTTVANFFGIDDANFRGGVRPALGDVNGDGTPDLAVAAGFLGGPRVALIDGSSVLSSPTNLVNDFFAFPGTDSITLRNGAFVSLGDVNGDGFADLIFGGGPGGAPRVFALSGQLVMQDLQSAYDNPIANFFVANNSTDRGGVRVAVKDADGDGQADVVVGSGEGSPANVRVYLAQDFNGSSEPTMFQDISVFGGAVLTSGVFVG